MKRAIYRVNRGCTLCGTCVYECPSGAIKLSPDGAVIDPERCAGCGICRENCASEAISRIVLERDAQSKSNESVHGDREEKRA